jgi:hypothetical protein
MRDQSHKTDGVAASARWWVLGGVALAAALGIGIVLSFDVARQTKDMVETAYGISDALITPKDRADLVRNAYLYQADNLTKVWTGIIGSLTGVAAVAAGVIAWRNLRATQTKLGSACRD